MREREYLVSLGLATPGRGRFSREAQAALQAAREAGRTFDQPVISAPREKSQEPTVRRIEVPDRTSYDPKAVRKWAAEQGMTLGSRGRIDREVIAQYLSLHGDVSRVIAEPSTAGQVLELRPRVHPVGTRFVHVDGKGRRHEIGDTNVDMVCGNSLSHCGCSAPRALVRGILDYVPVTMVGG